MEEIQISFILPVYNVEDYVAECINSIISQKDFRYEIILIDDGSTDNSGCICDEFADKYENIKSFHKNNGGLSDARNYGIHKAKGKYILFVDSDDYIDSKFLATLNAYLKDIREDVVFLNAIKVYPDGRKVRMDNGYDKYPFYEIDKSIFMDRLTRIDKYPASACDKLIMRKFILNNNLYFEKGRLSEDIEWTLRVLLRSNSIRYLDIDYYYYRQNRIGSISSTTKFKNFMDIFYVIEKWTSEDLNNKKFQKEINALLSYEYLMMLFSCAFLKGEERDILYKKLVDYKWLLHFGQYKRVKIANYISKFVSLNVLIKLVAFYKTRLNRISKES